MKERKFERKAIRAVHKEIWSLRRQVADLAGQLGLVDGERRDFVERLFL
ncbi:MAG: hypothetical protein ACTSU5_00295 [Promethearchaeota archaeon]